MAWIVLALPGLAACQPYPVAQCNAFYEARKDRLVECGAYASREEADADYEQAIRDSVIRPCGEADDILLRDLWELQCIPETREQPCSELDELPNACLGQLVFLDEDG